MPDEIKNSEILEAIHDFADHTEERFNSIETDIKGIKSDITGIKSVMVTKDYLDEKLADFRGDMVVLTRREDKKVMILVDILKDRKLIDDKDVKRIQSMEPFAQIT